MNGFIWKKYHNNQLFSWQKKLEKNFNFDKSWKQLIIDIFPDITIYSAPINWLQLIDPLLIELSRERPISKVTNVLRQIKKSLIFIISVHRLTQHQDYYC